jgi:hypothetical protein
MEEDVVADPEAVAAVDFFIYVHAARGMGRGKEKVAA